MRRFDQHRSGHPEFHVGILRTAAATVLAPLAVVPVLLAIFGPWALAHGGAPTVLGIVWPALLAAYPLLILFGLPMHIALLRQRRVRAGDYVLAGALLGAVPVIGYLAVAIMFEAKFILAAMPRAAARNLEWGAIGVGVFGACSAAVAIAFRAIAIPAANRTTTASPS